MTSLIRSHGIALSRRRMLSLMLTVAASALAVGSKREWGRPVLRLAIASDLHFGQPGVRSASHLDELRKLIAAVRPDLSFLQETWYMMPPGPTQCSGESFWTCSLSVPGWPGEITDTGLRSLLDRACGGLPANHRLWQGGWVLGLAELLAGSPGDSHGSCGPGPKMGETGFWPNG